MRVVAWSSTSNWSEFWGNVESIRRISRTKWELTYYVGNSYLQHGYKREHVYLIADNVWIEPQ